MFIFKKFQKQNSDQSSSNNGQSSRRGGGVQPMDQHLQRKFARGIQYNMKIIIRGDRNVGKTCLFYRLQGDKFHEEYLASEEIKVASIQWNYNATDDIVKVEIWDVVDKGKKREILSTQNQSLSSSKDVLKMHNNQNDHHQHESNDPSSSSSPALDAEFVDVYKGTNGVIYLFDMTKAWTFDYVQREIHRCPLHIPILILANHRDMGHHRVITGDQVQGFIESILQEDLESNRKRTGQIRYAECSMRNGFGLRYLYKFFNLPYLHLQRETMLKQLERNGSEINATCQELDAMINSDDYNYDSFLEMLTNKRRLMADQLSATKNVDQMGMLPPRSVSMPANMATMANGDSQQNHLISSRNQYNEPAPIVKPMPSIIIGANNPLPPKFQQQFQKNKPDKNHTTTTTPYNVSVKNIEDFIPDDGEQNMFRKFLDEPNLPQTDLPPVIDEEDSDDDDTMGNNQIVAKYQEELDPEDMIVIESNDNKLSISNENESSEQVVKNGGNEINSDPDDDHQNVEKLSETTSNVESEENQPNSEIPVLNLDEIEALENMYISKHSSQLNEFDVGDSNENEPPSTIKKKMDIKKSNNKSTTNGVTKKKKKSKTSDKQNGDCQQQQIAKKKKSTKLKTKNDNSSKNPASSIIIQDNDDDDDDRRQLEEFLGTTEMDNDPSRDHTSYQMF